MNYLSSKAINFPFYIAKRYLSSNRRKNVVHLITRISVIGIAVITASLIILLSAFNGIESIIKKLYSDFDADISIESSVGKTFRTSAINYKEIKAMEGVNQVSWVAEEVVVLKHEDKWVNARMVGVEPSFLEMSRMKNHMVDGEPMLVHGRTTMGLIGATLLDKLGGFIPQQTGYEEIFIYSPKRDARIQLGSNPFHVEKIGVSGRFNYNKEINADRLIVPLQTARDLLDYEEENTAIFVDVKKNDQIEGIKQQLQAIVGKNFKVKTSYEQNELIFKTSKSEKLIVLFILLFIFILAAFNLIASITMLFIEKKENIQTLIHLGADQKSVFSIFFYEGLLVSGKGILIGTVLGYAVCFLQLNFSLLIMPNSGGEAFPIALSWLDGLLILTLVSGLSALFAYLPVRLLLKKNFGHLRY